MGASEHMALPRRRALVSVGRALTSRWSGVCGVAVLAIGAVHPKDGMASGGAVLTSCPTARFTGVPCPGCGLTRSVACLMHGDPARSVAYHPGGVLVVLLCMSLVVTACLPTAKRERIAGWIDARSPARLMLWMVGAYLLFGVGRAVLYVMGWPVFPG